MFTITIKYTKSLLTIIELNFIVYHHLLLYRCLIILVTFFISNSFLMPSLPSCSISSHPSSLLSYPMSSYPILFHAIMYIIFFDMMLNRSNRKYKLKFTPELFLVIYEETPFRRHVAMETQVAWQQHDNSIRSLLRIQLRTGDHCFHSLSFNRSLILAS